MSIYYIYKKNMKKLLLCLLVISNSSLSQTKYSFDYLLHYEHTNHIDSRKSKTIYFLTNSKDNSYSARIIIKDSLNFSIYFFKHDLIISYVIVSKKNFEIAEFINIECKNVSLYSNSHKDKVQFHDFVKINEIDSLEIYEFKNIQPEKERKIKNTARYVLKFNTSYPFHLPNLIEGTPFEEWKKERDLPNNFISELLIYNSKNELESSEILVEYIKIDKKINILTEECGSILLEKITN
jgi:hypothetical protein